MDEKTKNMMPAKNEEDSIEKEVEYCERLLKTIEGMPVVPNLPRIIEKRKRKTNNLLFKRAKARFMRFGALH